MFLIKNSTASILQKADMAVADLASGGLLNPEQTDRFIEIIHSEPTILKQARFEKMNSPKKNIDKMGFATRIMRPAVSGTGLAVGDRSKPTTDQIQLDAKELIAEVRLPYDVIEDNIERGNINAAGANSSPKPVTGGVKDTIMKLIGKRVALDLEELGLLGDTAHATDTYLQVLDGYLKQITSNTVDHSAAAISKALFKNGLKTLPKQFHRDKTSLRNLISVAQETEYRNSLSDRVTGLGDSMIQGFSGVYGFGVPVQPTALMPEDQGILSPMLNLIWGVQRKVSVETDKDISARVYIIVVTVRTDFKIEDENAAVKYTNLG